MISKLDHQRSIFSQFYTNPSKLYSHLRKMSKRKSKPNVIIVDNGIIVSDSKEKATLFNNFFHSTFTQSDFVLPSVDRLPSPCVQLSCLEFD